MESDYLALTDPRIPRDAETWRQINEGYIPYWNHASGFCLLGTSTGGVLAYGKQRVEQLRRGQLDQLSTAAAVHSCSTCPRPAKWDEEAAKLTTPDPEQLKRSLLSHFQHRNGWNYCKPLNRWHRHDVPFLAGYVSTWGTPTDERSHCRCHLVMRPGCFQQVLSAGSPIQAWLGHHADLIAASTADRSLALLEDENGLAIFADVSGWKYGAALASLIRDGKLSQMSFYHDPDPSRVDTFALGGRSFKESLSVKSLPEVSFVARGGNASTIALAIGGKHDDSCGHYHARAWLLERATRPKE